MSDRVGGHRDEITGKAGIAVFIQDGRKQTLVHKINSPLCLGVLKFSLGGLMLQAR